MSCPHVAQRMKSDPAIESRLRELVEQFRTARDLKTWVALDIQFHQTLLEASGLQPLVAFGELLHVFFQRFRESVKKGEWKTGIDSHERIVDELAKGRVTAASAELRKHIESHKSGSDASTIPALAVARCWLSPFSAGSPQANWSSRMHPRRRESRRKVATSSRRRSGPCSSNAASSAMAVPRPAGLSLATANGWKKGGESGPAIIPGKPAESPLIDAIHYRTMQMPPADKGGKLPDSEIAILTQWVEMGAPDPRDGTDQLGGMSREDARNWWAFQPLPPTSEASPAADAQHIDELIQREIELHSLTATPPADRRTLIRRVTYDLTGLPPTPAEVEAFVADESPDTLKNLIDRLLDSPQYGVQWGRHWLDVVRYADTAGENTDRPLPHAWRYRNWVIDAFQRDMPFDQFVRLQLAGDLLVRDANPQEHAAGIIATDTSRLPAGSGTTSTRICI